MEPQTITNGQAQYRTYEGEKSTLTKRNGRVERKRTESGKRQKASLSNREFPALDWIHIIFLFYSGAHNAINAWNRADNGLFFLFVLVGILSVEIMLWSIYKYWKAGQLVGKMLRVGKFAGLIAMFYATAGILAQAQSGTAGEWLTLYYGWILPSSAPVMFFFAFWIQSVDPIMTAERDTTAYAYLSAIEEKKEALDAKRMKLDESRNRRKLHGHVMKKKLLALWKESESRRTKSTLKRAAVSDMPNILDEVGVSVKDANKQSRFTYLKTKYDAPKKLAENNKPANSAVNPRKMKGAHDEKKS